MYSPQYERSPQGRDKIFGLENLLLTAAFPRKDVGGGEGESIPKTCFEAVNFEGTIQKIPASVI